MPRSRAPAPVLQGMANYVFMMSYLCAILPLKLPCTRSPRLISRQKTPAGGSLPGCFYIFTSFCAFSYFHGSEENMLTLRRYFSFLSLYIP